MKRVKDSEDFMFVVYKDGEAVADFYNEPFAISYAEDFASDSDSEFTVIIKGGERDGEVRWSSNKVSDSRKIKDAEDDYKKFVGSYLDEFRKVIGYNTNFIPLNSSYYDDYALYKFTPYKYDENGVRKEIYVETNKEGTITKIEEKEIKPFSDSRKIKDADETQDVLDGILMIAFNDGSEEEGYNEVKKHANEQGELDGVQYETYDTDNQDGVTLIDLCAATDDANAFVKALLTEWGIIDAVADIEFEKSELMENAEEGGEEEQVSDSKVSDMTKPAHLRGYAEKYRKKRREQREETNEDETKQEVNDSKTIKNGSTMKSNRVSDSLEDDYEEYLNEVGEGLDEDEFIIGGKKRNMPYGTALRQYDPIAFNVGFDEWEREMEDDKEQFLGQIANQLEEGYHSGYDPQWDIDITVDNGMDISDFSDEDKDLIYQNIANVVKDGYDNYMDIETELSDGSIVYVDFVLNY